MAEFVSSELFSNIVSSVIVIVIVAVLLRVLLRVLRKMRVREQSETLRGILTDVVKWLILLTGFFIILEINGVDVSSFIAGLGLVSVIVGLALQDFLKDIIMGLHILIDGFYVAGDAVIYDGKECTVEEFNLKTTRLRELEDGTVIVLCNRNVEKIERMSRIVDIDIPLSYEDDTEVIRGVMKSLVEKVGELPEVESAAFMGTKEFGDSSIAYKLRFVTDPLKKPEMRWKVNGMIQDALHDAGIAIPFNQVDVHIK